MMTDWMIDAACAGLDPEIFFQDSIRTRVRVNDTTKHAISICEKCSVKSECLEHFIDEQFGVFGGKTSEERRRIRTKRRRVS